MSTQPRIVNGLAMVTRQAAHTEIARALELPQWYGRNLDALWDAVTDLDETVVFTNAGSMLEHLGEYGQRLLQTLREAALKNPRFILYVEDINTDN